MSTSATARWVVDAQAALQRGMASARADLEEPVAQGEATEAAAKQAGDEAPMPREAVALKAGDAKAPTIAEATEDKAEAPGTSKAEMAEVGISQTTRAEATEASLGAAEPLA